MGTLNNSFRTLLRVVALLLAFGAVSPVVRAQTADLSYPDKLFGGRYSFTAKADEIVVRLAAGPDGKASRSAAESLAANQGLEIVHDEGVENLGLVVYRTGPGKTATAALDALGRDPGVLRARAALLNEDGTTRYFMPGQVVVQFDPGLPERRMLDLVAQLGSTVVIDHWTPGFYTLSVPAGRDLFEQIRAFNDLSEVQFAELSTVSFNDEAFVPNDPNYSNQWAVKNTGPGFYTADADGDVEEAWDIERGNPGVIVAVIDSGVDWDHPDLQPNILQNLGEDDDSDGQTMIWNGANWVMDPGDINGVDDDGNGFVDDFFGWDFSSGDNNPNPSTSAHGTACAGLAAGVADNATGIAGVAHGCRIMPLRINLTSGMNQNRADAINYAVAQAPNYAAMVVSCSWFCSSGSLIAVQNAVINARAAGVLPVFAAGNFNGAVSFPANLNAAMAIAATSPCDERKNPGSCDGENWGSNFGNPLSIGSPGVLMETTDIAGAGGYTGGDYTSSFNGTSSACPFTAGAVALLHSEAIELTGSGLTPNDAQRLLEDSAEQVGGYAYPGGFSQELGNGRINVNEALQLLIAEQVEELLPPLVDLSLSIDRSFSMVGDNILAAENAAAQVVRLLDVGDRIAVTSYSGGADPGGLPDWPAWTDFGMTEIVGEATKNAAIAAIETGGDVYNLTAIGAGMIKARDELFAAIPAQYPQSVILLSDGNNTDGPDPLTVLPLAAPEPTVHTIGFGSFADEPTLAGIAAATGGQYFFAGTSGSKMGGTLPLIQTYQLSLMEATERENLGWIRGQIRDQGEDRHFFMVDDSVDQLLIALLWGYLDPQAFELFLQDPAGVTYDMSSPEWLGDETTSAYRIPRPEPGEWFALVRRVGGGDGSGNYNLNLAGSSRVKSNLILIPRGFGLPLLAKLSLGELVRGSGFKPVTGADVVGTITYPNGEFDNLFFNDQGQGDDEIPDDGVYCATVQNTFANGTYAVETEAFGQTVEGFLFTRYDLASAVLIREEDPPPIPVQLTHLFGLPGTVFEIPILVPQWVDPFDIVRVELGFAFDSDVIRFLGLSDLAGTMMESWNVDAEDQGNGVAVRGEGEPLQGEGLLLLLKFQIVGPLGASTPTVFTQLEFRNPNDALVPTLGMDGSVAVGSANPDRTATLYPVQNGWRMRSLPVVLGPEEQLQDQLPAAEEILGWMGDYTPTGNPGAGQGFWMLYGGPDGEEILIGDPLGMYSQILPAGWSLIGGLFNQTVVPMVEPAATIVNLFLYDPNLGYAPATQIAPGQGLWLFAAEPFTLTVEAEEEMKVGRDRTAEKMLVQARLFATGDAVQGVPSVNHVVIGAGATMPEQIPFPPPPPEYSTLMFLQDVDDPAVALYSDSRTDAEGEFWFLGLRPGGNVGGSGSTISWDPDGLSQIADTEWIMYEGLGTDGAVVVPDMRDVSSFTVAGPNTQQFTILASGPTAAGDDVVPTAFALAGNHPNPFNPMTTIRFDVPRPGHVRVEVMDVRGRRVATLVDRVVQPGRHSVIWDGRDHDGANLPSGVYFSRLTAEGVKFTDRMTLLK